MRLGLCILLFFIGLSGVQSVDNFDVGYDFLDGTDNAVFMDYENKICYVDLMAFDQAVLRISLQDDMGQELESVNCLQLGVSEIIEFDLQGYSQNAFVLKFELPTMLTSASISID